jgi:hypothetical protein
MFMLEKWGHSQNNLLPQGGAKGVFISRMAPTFKDVNL